jgi:hypothetical protein
VRIKEKPIKIKKNRIIGEVSPLFFFWTKNRYNSKAQGEGEGEGEGDGEGDGEGEGKGGKKILKTPTLQPKAQRCQNTLVR